MYVYPFKVENTLIEGTVPVHIYMANFGCPLPSVHLLYNLQTARAHGMGHVEHSGAKASPYTSYKCIKIISQVMPVYPHSKVQNARPLHIAN